MRNEHMFEYDLRKKKIHLLDFSLLLIEKKNTKTEINAVI